MKGVCVNSWEVGDWEKEILNSANRPELLAVNGQRSARGRTIDHMSQEILEIYR